MNDCSKIEEKMDMMNDILIRIADSLEALSSCVYVVHTGQGDAKEFSIYLDIDGVDK